MPEQIERDKKEQVVDTWRVAGYDSIELHRGASITMDYARYWHDELYLCAIMDGEGDLDCLGSSYATLPGALVLIPSARFTPTASANAVFAACLLNFRHCKAP